MHDEERAARECHDLFVSMLPELRGWMRRHGLADQADDVISDVFTVAWDRWEQLPTALDDRRAYVYGIARRKAAHVRQEAARTRARQDRYRLAAPDPLVPDHAHRLAADHHVRALLAELPPTEREAVAATYLEGRTPTDAARALGITATALTSRLQRARTRLAALVARLDEGAEESS